MKKTVVLLFAAFLLMLTACGVAQPAPQADLERSPYSAADELSDISVTVAEGTVGTKAESVSLTIRNLSGKEYSYGAPYELEKEVDGVWYKYPPQEEMAFIMILYILEPNGTGEETVSLYSFFGELQPGTYRVVKSFSAEDAQGVAFGVFDVK
jgi:hypothetical protein